MKIEVKTNQETKEIEATRQGETILIEWEGRGHTAEIVRNDGGELIFSLNGRLIRIIGEKRGNGRQIWVNGRLLDYQRVVAGAAGDTAEAEGALSATIPAVVVDVLVAVGDEVKAGDKLILLESMKMVIPIVAPQDGQIQAIHCATGDAVQPGVALVEM